MTSSSSLPNTCPNPSKPLSKRALTRVTSSPRSCLFLSTLRAITANQTSYFRFLSDRTEFPLQASNKYINTSRGIVWQLTTVVSPMDTRIDSEDRVLGKHRYSLFIQREKRQGCCNQQRQECVRSKVRPTLFKTGYEGSRECRKWTV